jgi:hypothetical protein
MNRNEFRGAVADLLGQDVSGMSWEEKLGLVRSVLVQMDQDHEREESNRGRSWTDDELRCILQTAPTRENCMLFARVFKRGFGSIEQIYRWAAEPDKVIDEKRPDDAFVQQIKRIRREIGWVGT